MINVCCVLYDKNDIDKVENLYNNVQKNLTATYKFYCFTYLLTLKNR